MANEAATKGDKLNGDPTTLHKWKVGNSPMSSACAFSASISGAVSADVLINGKEAATAGSSASQKTGDDSVPSDAVPAPATKGTITGGSQTVLINTLAAARNGDAAECCSPTGTVVVEGTATVFIGG